MMPETAVITRASPAPEEFEGLNGPGENARELIVDSIRRMHRDYSFCGRIPNQLLMQRDDLVLYVRSLLSDELPGPPEASLEEWYDLVSVLRCHWVIPLLYKKARALPMELRPPAEIMGRWKAAYLQGMEHAARTDRQIGEIVERFASAGIMVLLLKGAAFSRTIYPDPATRYGSDLDFLVAPANVPQARRTLEGLGYRCIADFFDQVSEGYSEEVFIDGSGGGWREPVEIHWSRNNVRLKRGADLDDLFLRAVKFQTPWLTGLTPGPVDSLIEAASHLVVNHRVGLRLSWIYDISLLASRLKAPEDWRALQGESVRYGARISTERALRLAELWTGFRIPPEFADFSQWPAPSADEIRLHRILASRNEVIIRLMLSAPAGTASLEKARFFWHILFPPADFMRHTYPPPRKWLLPLSYVVRLARNVRKP
jgi:hypothetical protein